MRRIYSFNRPKVSSTRRRNELGTNYLYSFFIEEYAVQVGMPLHFANLCLTYLTLDCFQQCSDKSQMEPHIINGSYSFLEYASTHAVDHIKECVTEEGSKIDGHSELSGKVNDFLQSWDELDNGT